MITVGTYSCTDGSQFGMLALHRLIRQMPLLLNSRKQVRNSIENLNVEVHLLVVKA